MNNDQLFDATDYIDPDAITQSLDEVRGFQMQSPRSTQPQRQQQVPQQSVVQAPQQKQDDGGILGTILSVFM